VSNRAFIHINELRKKVNWGYYLNEKLIETIMDNETPRPMKKVHRNIFHKVGKKLGKLEQNIGISSSPSLSDDSRSSFNNTPTNYRHSHSENNEEQDDSISLQYFPNLHSESPKAILRHKHGLFFLF
jgi:hypothetical protein